MPLNEKKKEKGQLWEIFEVFIQNYLTRRWYKLALSLQTCFCSISISGSPCGWYYLLPTILTTLGQHNYVVTLTLRFFRVLLIPTVPSQPPEEYAGPFCMTLPFSATVNIFLPQFYLSLQHHFTATASLLSAHHKGIFISQVKLTITHWKSAETMAGMEKQIKWISGAVPSHSHLLPSSITCL